MLEEISTCKYNTYETVGLRISNADLPHFDPNQDNLEVVVQRIRFTVFFTTPIEIQQFALSKIVLSVLMGIFLLVSTTGPNRKSHIPELTVSEDLLPRC